MSTASAPRKSRAARFAFSSAVLVANTVAPSGSSTLPFRWSPTDIAGRGRRPARCTSSHASLCSAAGAAKPVRAPTHYREAHRLGSGRAGLCALKASRVGRRKLLCPAQTTADDQFWIDTIKTEKAVIILEPDAIANLPGDCGYHPSRFKHSAGRRRSLHADQRCSDDTRAGSCNSLALGAIHPEDISTWIARAPPKTRFHEARLTRRASSLSAAVTPCASTAGTASMTGCLITSSRRRPVSPTRLNPLASYA